MLRNTLANLPDKAFLRERPAIEKKLLNDLEEVIAAAEVGDKTRAKQMMVNYTQLISRSINEAVIPKPAADLTCLCRDFLARL